MGAATLPGDYQFLDSLAIPLAVVSFVLVAVGSFLRRDGYPAHHSVGLLTEGIGWVALIAGQVVLAQIASQQGLECSLWHRCDALEAGPAAYLWQGYLRPALLDAALLAVAEAIGWGIAKLTPRRPV